MKEGAAAGAGAIATVAPAVVVAAVRVIVGGAKVMTVSQRRVAMIKARGMAIMIAKKRELAKKRMRKRLRICWKC